MAFNYIYNRPGGTASVEEFVAGVDGTVKGLDGLMSVLGVMEESGRLGISGLTRAFKQDRAENIIMTPPGGFSSVPASRLACGRPDPRRFDAYKETIYVEDKDVEVRIVLEDPGVVSDILGACDRANGIVDSVENGAGMFRAVVRFPGGGPLEPTDRVVIEGVIHERRLRGLNDKETY